MEPSPPTQDEEQAVEAGFQRNLHIDWVARQKEKAAKITELDHLLETSTDVAERKQLNELRGRLVGELLAARDMQKLVPELQADAEAFEREFGGALPDSPKKS